MKPCVRSNSPPPPTNPATTSLSPWWSPGAPGLDLHRQLAAAKTPDERTRLERQIAATDQRIDRLVYDLYGLTAEEIKIVEGELSHS